MDDEMLLDVAELFGAHLKMRSVALLIAKIAMTYVDHLLGDLIATLASRWGG